MSVLIVVVCPGMNEENELSLAWKECSLLEDIDPGNSWHPLQKTHVTRTEGTEASHKKRVFV